jgi:hypothetical protein
MKARPGTMTRRRPVSSARKSAAAVSAASEVGKRVTFDRETWQAIDLLARDSMKSFQELADESFRDLLDKHRRPDTLREALRASAALPTAVTTPMNPPRRRGDQ